MLIYKGQIIAGGGTIVMPMTRAEYEANKAVLDSADVWVDLTDEPDSVADGECIQYDSDLNFEDIGNIATKAIAKVEPSDTALYLHKVGDGFINKDGNYCITDVQISVGGTITLGTNCHVVDGGMSSKLTNLIPTGFFVSSTGITLNVTSGTRAIIVFISEYADTSGLAVVRTYGNGTSLVHFIGATGITATSGTNTITFNVNANHTTDGYITTYAGSITK